MTETFSTFTTHEIETMPMDEFARLAGRQTIGQAATQAFETEPPGRPRQESAPAQSAPQPPAAEPQGIDVASMDMQTYAQLRGQLGMGRSHKEGRGIFDSESSRSEAYTNAVRAQSGRTAWNNANVVEPPRLERPYVKQDVQIDTRSARDRFATPGNSWQG